MYKNRMPPGWISDAGRWVWREQLGQIGVFFAGRGGIEGTSRSLKGLLPGNIGGAWACQVHSSDILEAQPGQNGEGDGLVTGEKNLAVSVVTADCVPVLFASGQQVGAVHAGWRGIVGGIVQKTARFFVDPVDCVWIGPAIGPCCYEVGEDVARRVCEASSDSVRNTGPRRPHLDLVEAVAIQLKSVGIWQIRRVEGCTYCDAERFWSFRRDGKNAGRNLSMIWRA